jgi:hypothetical protein
MSQNSQSKQISYFAEQSQTRRASAVGPAEGSPASLGKPGNAWTALALRKLSRAHALALYIGLYKTRRLVRSSIAVVGANRV